jgi:hypothetical protein
MKADRIPKWYAVRTLKSGRRFPIVHHLWAFSPEDARERHSRNLAADVTIVSVEQQHR